MPNSKLIGYSERGKPRLSFGYKSVGLPWKLLKLYPTVHLYLSFSSHSIVLFPLRTPTTWGSAKCIRRLFKVWRNCPNSKLICFCERENLGFHLDINLSASLENFSSYTQPYSHISFFSSHCIVLFPLRTLASWSSAKCTRKLCKVWENSRHSKMICYSERWEPRLSFGYKFIGLPWKLLKLYPTVHSCLLFPLHCIVSTKNTDNLREC